jgi:hypothetical protein
MKTGSSIQKERLETLLTRGVLHLQLDGLFSDTEYLGPSPLDFCASQPLAVKYIWAITFEWQAYHLLKCDRLAADLVPLLQDLAIYMAVRRTAYSCY